MRTFRISPTLDAKVRSAAERDGLSVSQLIKLLLTQYVAREIVVCKNRYSPKVLRALERESDAALKTGKRFSSADAFLKDLKGL